VVLVIEIGENLKENPEVGHWGHWDNSKKLYLCSYEKENCFYGWFADENIVGHVKNVLSSKSLGYVFDLDETLVKAFTHSGLTKMRSKPTMDLDIDSVEKWTKVLDQFTKPREDGVRAVQSPFYPCQWVEAKMVRAEMFSGRTINRPVIRIENDEDSSEIFLTFIDPDRVDTAMIFFIRPGWTRLRSFLASKRDGDTGGGPLVYVSTKAPDPDYAYVAWTLLDPNSKLIPREEYKGRIESVHKDRIKTFSSCIFGTTSENPERDNSSRDKLVQMQDRIPFALAIDVRDDVWTDKTERSNWQVDLLHKVAPYNPMKKKPTGFKESEEMCQVYRVFEKAEEIMRGLLDELNEKACKMKDPESTARVSFGDFSTLEVNSHSLLKDAKQQIEKLDKEIMRTRNLVESKSSRSLGNKKIVLWKIKEHIQSKYQNSFSLPSKDAEVMFNVLETLVGQM